MGIRKSPLFEMTDPSMRLVIDFLVENRGLDYSKQQIAAGAGISRPTLYRIWPAIVKNSIIIPTRKFGNTQLYKANEGNILVQFFVGFEKAIIARNMEKMKLRTPDQLEADKQKQDELDEMERQINQQIKDQLQYQ